MAAKPTAMMTSTAGTMIQDATRSSRGWGLSPIGADARGSSSQEHAIGIDQAPDPLQLVRGRRRRFGEIGRKRRAEGHVVEDLVELDAGMERVQAHLLVVGREIEDRLVG